MTDEIDRMFEEHKKAFSQWFAEETDRENKNRALQMFIKEHNLPEDITIGELLDYCRKLLFSVSGKEYVTPCNAS